MMHIVVLAESKLPQVIRHNFSGFFRLPYRKFPYDAHSGAGGIQAATGDRHNFTASKKQRGANEVRGIIIYSNGFFLPLRWKEQIFKHF